MGLKFHVVVLLESGVVYLSGSLPGADFTHIGDLEGLEDYLTIGIRNIDNDVGGLTVDEDCVFGQFAGLDLKVALSE